MTLIRVMQQHESGCVPSCIAMLTGLSYKEALRTVYPWKKTKGWDHYGTRHEDMLLALKRLGFKYTEKEPMSFAKLRSNAIVLVEHQVYGPPGQRSHAMVWDYSQQRILDPYVGRGLKRHLPRKSYEKCCDGIIEVRGVYRR